jgi:hypothetical protein
LKRFHSSSEVIAHFDQRYSNGKKWNKIYLQLYVIGAGPPFVPRRISLNPRACGGATYRYAAEGWGLQLYLGNLHENGKLESSHTNHYTRTRAEAWARGAKDKDEPASWDFTRITSFSAHLNREIRKRSVSKIGSMVVLPEAHELWQGGVSLLP